MPIDLSIFDVVLLDLDGTVYHEDHPLAGAVELIRKFQNENRRFACLSNSSSSPLRVMERLHAMGVDLVPDQIYTAAAAACDYVIQNFPEKSPGILIPGHPSQRKPRVFNLATESVQEMLEGLVDWVQTGGEPCDLIFAAAPSCMYATEERQRIALQLLRKGAALVGLCADRVYPSPRGLEFGSGAMCAMLSYAANVKPFFCGKPERIFFVELCERLNVEPSRCVLIGDNLESDVSGAKPLGMATILTLSGVTRRRDLLNLAAELQPDHVVEDLAELL
jgi:HAD superfamily hydrolase (TIGR01450 family)